MSTTVSYGVPPHTAYTTASYDTTASVTAEPYTAYTTSTYMTPSREPGHAPQLSEESEDPLATIDPAAGMTMTGSSTRETQARHVRFGSHGSDDSSDLADAFAQVDICGPAAQQQQLVAAEAEPLLAGTHVKKGMVRFEHAGQKFKTRSDQWVQVSTTEGAVYWQFTHPSSGQSYWTWDFGQTLESQLAVSQGLGDQTSGTGRAPQQQPQDQSPLAAAATAATAGAEPTSAAFPAAPSPLMHFPHCRLNITHIPYTHNDGTASASSPGKIEQIALPGALVRTLLSHFEETQQPSFPGPPSPPGTSPPPPTSSSSSLSSAYSSDDRERKTTFSTSVAPNPLLRMRIQRHFDDADDWVFSRFLLADFTDFREDEAEALSAQGQLCFWASVVLQPLPQSQPQGEEQGVRMWELGFVVQRVGVTDQGSGWCECF
ncbi:hypothetical protein NEMBOFW57_006193 [Staphylotrichum longicolle]|uniref:Uncharacterized protein n=1 Tax=Staphylotrichum longicolle TaxID=669026 RepID=A0AAD4I0C4_9PEZI|nr:hypothetical protein NEMBOFW57_006193 [Staphylotrichum longicolle]